MRSSGQLFLDRSSIPIPFDGDSIHRRQPLLLRSHSLCLAVAPERRGVGIHRDADSMWPRHLTGIHPLIAGVAVRVRVAQNLIASCRALARGHNRPRQEELLQPEQVLACCVVGDGVELLVYAALSY